MKQCTNHSGLGRLMAMSTRREMNSLACLHYRQEFGRQRIYRLRNLGPSDNDNGRASLASPLLSPALFDDNVTHGRLLQLFDRGWRIKSTALSDAFDWSQYLEQYRDDAVLLFALTDKGTLRIASAKRDMEPKPGWTVTALVPSETLPGNGADGDGDA